MTTRRQPNYMRQILAFIDSGRCPTVGVIDVDVAHDSWCGIFAGQPCDCNCIVTVRHDYGRLCAWCRYWATIIPDSGELRAAYNAYLAGLGVVIDDN